MFVFLWYFCGMMSICELFVCDSSWLLNRYDVIVLFMFIVVFGILIMFRCVLCVLSVVVSVL